MDSRRSCRTVEAEDIRYQPQHPAVGYLAVKELGMHDLKTMCVALLFSLSFPSLWPTSRQVTPSDAGVKSAFYRLLNHVRYPYTCMGESSSALLFLLFVPLVWVAWLWVSLQHFIRV